jgi:beta-lactamase regulating signal transducer with metallopeptidase domain/biopolymer transport protein ExbD
MIEILNEFGSRWAAYFAAALVQNTVFVALVLLILHRIRHMSAQIRYAVGVIGMIKLLLPPFVPARLGIGTVDMLESTEGFTGLIPFSPAGASTLSVVQPAAQLSVVGILFAAWIAIVVAYILASIISTLRLAWRLRGTEHISDVEGYAASTPIRIYMSQRIAVPMTLGLFPRRIFVPAAWTRWSDECRRMVLRHESAHIARRDGLVQALQIVAQALYFFHPLVLILGRRLGEYREMACDDLSAEKGGCAGVEYSRFLVEIAESIAKIPAACESASTLIRKRNELLSRVRYQMKGGAIMSKGKTIGLLAALFLLVLPLSWYHTSAASEKKERQARSSRGRERGDREVERPSRPMQERSPRPAPPTLPAKPAPPEYPAGGSISVVVGGEESVVVDGGAVAWALVKERLRKIVGDDDTKVVKLQCADETTMEQINRIHEMLRETGLNRIEYRNGEGYRAPLVLPPPDIEERLGEIDAIAIADVRVDASGKVTLDGEPVELSKLSGVVAKRLEEVPPLVVTVQTMKRTVYKDFLGVLAALKKADAKRIVIKEPAAP